MKSKPEEFMRIIAYEYEQASIKFPEFNSSHEGYAVINEELDELWDCIKANRSYGEQRAEAIQVAAMALRFLVDLC